MYYEYNFAGGGGSCSFPFAFTSSAQGRGGGCCACTQAQPNGAWDCKDTSFCRSENSLRAATFAEQWPGCTVASQIKGAKVEVQNMHPL